MPQAKFHWVKALVLLVIVALAVQSAHAGIMVFAGDAGETMMIETSPGLGKDEVLISFTGINSPWANKVFKARRETTQFKGERFSFDYDLELTGKTIKKTYYVALDNGKALVNGTLTRKITVFYHGVDRNGVQLVYDAEQTKKSSKLNLKDQFSKSPYKPEIE